MDEAVRIKTTFIRDFPIIVEHQINNLGLPEMSSSELEIQQSFEADFLVFFW